MIPKPIILVLISLASMLIVCVHELNSFCFINLGGKMFCFINWGGNNQNNTMTVQSIMSVLLTKPVCFSFYTWLSFNSICFCLELFKILPSWTTKSPFMFWRWKGKCTFMKKVFFWSWAFPQGSLFEAILSVLLNNSHWTNCLGCWILLFTSIEECCVCMSMFE